MQKTKTKMITLLLLATLSLAVFPLSAFASTGNIFINPASVTPPIHSALNQHYPAGSAVNLYFGSVSFSGGQFVLYLSTNGFSDIVTRNGQPDIPYSSTFDVVNLTDTVSTHVYSVGALTWTIGSGWINGSIPTNIAGGAYFVKAFDGSQTSVAVTDTAFVVDPGVSVTPNSGNAGASITFSGSAFLPNAYLNLSYNIGSQPPVWFMNLTQTGVIGNFSVTIPAPDAMQALAAGITANASTVINFAAAINGTTTVVSAPIGFTEWARGLSQVKQGTGGSASNQQPGTGNLFGNLTSFEIGGAQAVTGLGVGKTLRIAGNYFYANSIASITWDNAIALGTATVSAAGVFNTTVTVPLAPNGQHNITIRDTSNTAFVFFITVVPSLTLSPVSGPIGTTVTATGYGFTAPTTGNVVNASLQWNAVTKYVASGFVDSTGSFTLTFVVPNSPGGINNVTALQNATGSFVSTATATFTVAISFTVAPATFANNASLLVVATGSGFKTNSIYFPNIDNQMFGFGPLSVGLSPWQTGIIPDNTGTITITFVGAGFAVGSHVISLYENQTTTPAAYAGFNVTSDPVGSSAMLDAINQTVTQTNTTVNTINNNLNLINATIINIHDDIATVNTLLGKVDVNLTAIGAKVTAIQGTEATIQTTLGTIQTSLASINTIVTTINGNTATLSTTIGTLTTTVSSLSSSISSITSGIAQIQTSVGALSTPLSNLDSKLSSVLADTATIKTSLGSITTSLSSIGTTVTGISGNVATIQTSIGTLQGNITSISGNIATIQTNLGTLQADVSTIKTGVSGLQTSVGTVQSSIGSLQSDVTTVKSDVASNKTTSESLSPLIIVAIVLALIAAIAAIASIVLMRRKIAG